MESRLPEYYMIYILGIMSVYEISLMFLLCIRFFITNIQLLFLGTDSETLLYLRFSGIEKIMLYKHE